MSKGAIAAIVAASVVCGLFVGAVGAHAMDVGWRALAGGQRAQVRAQFTDGQVPAAGAGMMQGGAAVRGGRMMGGARQGLQGSQGDAVRQRIRQRLAGTGATSTVCPNCGVDVAPGTGLPAR